MNDTRKRVAVFVDGFNLWHAIADLRRPELKWLDLRKLASAFVDATEDVGEVRYFTAIAGWKPAASQARHRAYIAALESRGVTVMLGQFKASQMKCKSCACKWTKHSEKHTDVHLAVVMSLGAAIREYDVGLLVSGDADFSIPVSALQKYSVQQFGYRMIRVISPPGRRASKELLQAEGRKKPSKILPIHLERAQLPDVVLDANGVLVAERPERWKAAL